MDLISLLDKNIPDCCNDDRPCDEGSNDLFSTCNKIIKEYSGVAYKNGACDMMHCFVDHDGYDRYGPKSNLFDLIICYSLDVVDCDENGNYNKVIQKMHYVDVWHTEQWYTKDEVLVFDKMYSYYVSPKSYDALLSMKDKHELEYKRITRIVDDLDIIEREYCIYDEY